MKYKFVACDMDGTLLNSDYKVSEKNVEVINRYIDAGGIFTVATGRNYHSATMCLKELKITAPVICFHGSLIADVKTGKTVKDFAIAANDSVELLSWLREKDVYTQVYIGDLIMTEKETAITKWYHEICGVKAIVTGQPLADFVKKDQRGMLKILAVAEPPVASVLVEQINAKFGGVVHACTSRTDFVEISCRTASKAVAIDFVLDSYGLKRSELLVIGDAMNDIPMLKIGGMSAAMENAEPQVKAAAKFVADTNDNDGVAKVIERFCF